MFTLSCESTVDMPFSYMKSRNIEVLFYSCLFDGEAVEDDMGRNEQALKSFYEKINSGNIPSTSQINIAQYEDFFEALLQKGDLLHIVFSSGLTKSYDNAVFAAENLKAKYPERKIEVIDSLCASGGYGMLVDYAADLRDEGKSFDEIKAWLLENRLNIHHRFFSSDIKYYRRTGRISGPAASMAAILNICPVMHLDPDGKIIAHGKVRGLNGAISNTVSVMKQLAKDSIDYSGKCFIVHSDCYNKAEKLKCEIERNFMNLVGKIKILDIGMIIASHCGPNTVALFFMGTKRTE